MNYEKGIIAFVSQKGGVGKSTLSRAAAVELVRNGYKVAVADLDTQQETFLDWYKRRIESGLPPINSVAGYESFAEVKAIRNSDTVDFLIVDAAARSSKETLDISAVADLIIQPSGAGLDDLKPAVLLFHELKGGGGNTERLFIALCRVGTKSEENAARDYIKSAGYNALDGCILEKPSYRISQNEGRTILEGKYPNLQRQADILIQSLFDNYLTINEGSQ
jgi:chromosome partitioning protein